MTMMNIELNPEEVKVLTRALQTLKNFHCDALDTSEFNSVQNCNLKDQYLRELEVVRNLDTRLGARIWWGPQEQTP